MKTYILSIDQGTTGTTAALIDADDFSFIAEGSEDFRQIFPQLNHVEHDLNDIWKSVENTVSRLLRNHSIKSYQIRCIGITNQRETTCPFRRDGTPVSRAIVWQDRRTADYCTSLKRHAKKVRSLTGLPINPYFSATKMNWLLENDERVRAAARQDDLLLGTIDSFLLYKLTGGAVFATEASNASRTLLMNIETCNWDNSLLKLFRVDKKFLPEIKNSMGNFGSTKNLTFLPDGIPITGILGDQQAALLGQAGTNPGDMKCTYGTGAFLLLNIGRKIKFSKNGLLTTVAFKYKNKPCYALEGSCYIAGAAVQWLRDNLGIISSAGEIEALANEIKSPEEIRSLFFMPFFTGIGAPYWNSRATGVILGLGRDTQKKHLARACIEGIAFSVNDLTAAFGKDAGIRLKRLNVDGGAVVNNLLMQTQADVCNIEISRPIVIETTVYGAGLAAAIGMDILDLKSLAKFRHEDRRFIPQKSNISFYNAKKIEWSKLIKKLW